MGCIASKKTETTNIELNEASKENTDQIGLTKRQRFVIHFLLNVKKKFIKHDLTLTFHESF